MLLLEKHANEGQMAIGFSQELMDTASDVEVLSFIKILLKRFEYCQQFKASLDPKVNLTDFFPKLYFVNLYTFSDNHYTKLPI